MGKWCFESRSFTHMIRLNSPALNPAHQMTSGTQKTSRGSEKDSPVLQEDIVLPNRGRRVDSVSAEKQNIWGTFLPHTWRLKRKWAGLTLHKGPWARFLSVFFPTQFQNSLFSAEQLSWLGDDCHLQICFQVEAFFFHCSLKMWPPLV